MRELTVRIKFTKDSLGNVKARDGSGRFLMPRDPAGHVTFLASWHHANFRFAAQLLGRHQREVGAIFWDIRVDGRVARGAWHRRYYTADSGRTRFVLHEAFAAGQIVGLNCVVPSAIGDDDFWRLMAMAGQYRGLSPWHPGEYGHYAVESVRPRRAPPQETEEPAARPAEGCGPCTGNEKGRDSSLASPGP